MSVDGQLPDDIVARVKERLGNLLQKKFRWFGAEERNGNASIIMEGCEYQTVFAVVMSTAILFCPCVDYLATSRLKAVSVKARKIKKRVERKAECLIFKSSRKRRVLWNIKANYHLALVNPAQSRN